MSCNECNARSTDRVLVVLLLRRCAIRRVSPPLQGPSASVPRVCISPDTVMRWRPRGDLSALRSLFGPFPALAATTGSGGCLICCGLRREQGGRCSSLAAAIISRIPRRCSPGSIMQDSNFFFLLGRLAFQLVTKGATSWIADSRLALIGCTGRERARHSAHMRTAEEVLCCGTCP